MKRAAARMSVCLPCLSIAASMGLMVFCVDVIGSVIHAGKVHRSTCVICRVERVDRMYLGRRSMALHETSCSEWYRQNMKPHYHRWVQSPSYSDINMWGRGTGIGTDHSAPFRVIWALSPDEQLLIYRNFDDPQTARDRFSGILDNEMKGAEFIRAATSWMEAEFTGEWQDFSDL